MGPVAAEALVRVRRGALWRVGRRGPSRVGVQVARSAPSGRVWYWLPATKAVGLPWLTFHDLRRANATALVTAGVDLKTAQTHLGHSDPRLTLAVYAQATTAADRDAADRVAALFQARPAEAEEDGLVQDECAMEVPWALPRAPPSRDPQNPYQRFSWSGRRDLNLRPQRPERYFGGLRRTKADHYGWSGD